MVKLVNLSLLFTMLVSFFITPTCGGGSRCDFFSLPSCSLRQGPIWLALLRASWLVSVRGQLFCVPGLMQGPRVSFPGHTRLHPGLDLCVAAGVGASTQFWSSQDSLCCFSSELLTLCSLLGDT